MSGGFERPGPLALTALAVPGLLFGAAIRIRNRLHDAGLLPRRRLPCPVVVFGNLTVGGTGKTPLTSFTAAFLRDAGYRVGLLSRGHRRRGSAPLLVSDGRRLLEDAAAAGDEPYLMARDNPAVPVAVGADRVAAARLLFEVSAPEVVLLDDGFQHRALHRDLDLLLADGRDPFGNGRILPFGPLREPIRGVGRADALIITRGDGSIPPPLARALERYHPDLPVFHAAITPRGFTGSAGEVVDRTALAGRKTFAFAGIARPERFEADLGALGLRLAGMRRFPDHHPFRAADLEEIARAAGACGAEVLVTTEKDLVRLPAPPAPAPPLYALAVGVSFGDDRFGAFLLDRLASLGRPRAERKAGPR